MSFLKKIFKKDDDIPEMHLQKNEPKPYYSKEHQCWLIPGKEKEMIEAIAKQKKDPPKKQSLASQVQPSSSSSLRQKPAINRYAMITPTENITEKKPLENKEETRESKENNGLKIDTINNITQYEKLSEQNNDKPRKIERFKPENFNSQPKLEDANQTETNKILVRSI